MSDFYRLVGVVEEDTSRIEITSHEDFSFGMGERFPPDFPEPVVFEVDQEVKGTLVPTLFLPQPVFRLDFLSDLRSAGVTNIDDYEARIIGLDPRSLVTPYRAVNIIGLVACADLDKSKFESFEGMTFFDHFVIDERLARGAHFFRLAEAHEYVLASKKIVDRIDLSPYPDVRFEKVE